MQMRGPAPKGMKGAPEFHGFVLSAKRSGKNAPRPLPETAMAMDDPGAEPDLSAGRDPLAANDVVGDRLAQHMGRRRIKPQGFEHRHPQARPMPQIVEALRPLRREGREFGADPVLLVRVERKQVAQPEHQAGGRLETRHQHGRALIADFHRRNSLARFGIAHGEQQIEQVAPRARPRRRAPLRDQGVNRLLPLHPEFPPAARKESERHLFAGENIEYHRPPDPFEIESRHGAQFFAALGFGEREQSPEHRVQRRILKIAR